jgi:peptide/nickel transport system substrate-binding protein
VKKVITKKVVWLGLALCIIASMMSFACGEAEPEAPAPVTPTPAPEKPTPAPEEAPQYGGTLTILSLGSPRDNLGAPAAPEQRWNPFVPYPCVEQLLHWDEQGLLVPYLATDWEWSADHLSLTLPLQKGVKFHDGTEFNAEAVKYNLDLIKDSARPEMKKTTSVDIIDDYTVRINLNEFDNLQLVDLATVAGAMVSPTAIETYGLEHNILNPVGTGPFKFASYERDVNCVYERFDDYWQEGKPYLDGIEFIFMADPVTAKASFLAGEGQIIGDISPQDASEIQQAGDYNVAAAPNNIFAICGDGSHPDSPFGKPEVRQAISHAIDTQSIIDAVGYGFLEPTNQAAHKAIWSYNPDVVGYPYDQQKARDLLAEAGYPDGFQTTLYYSTGMADIEFAVMAIQQQLAEVGINVELEPVARARETELSGGGWENSLMTTTMTAPIGYSPFNTLIKRVSARAHLTVSVYHPEEFETKLDQAIIEPDQDKVVEIMHDLQKILIDDYCVVTPIYARVSICAKDKSLHDVQMYEPWGADWRPGNAWFEK